MTVLSLDLRKEQVRQSGERFILISILLMIFFMSIRTPIDTDFWWHLRAGQETVQSGRPMLIDNLSYTREGATWHNHSWLAEVILYLLYQNGGSIAIALMVAVVATASLGLLLLQMEGPAIFRGAVVILAAIVESWLWSPRPQLFSLLLLALIGYILYLYIWKDQNHLWLFIPIFILWSNLHAGYTLGLLLIGSMFAGELINYLPGYPSVEKLSLKKILYLAIWGLISGFVVIINPNGVNTWFIPFQTVQIQALQQYISEWASPDFHVIGQQSFLWLLFASFTALAISRRKVRGSDLISLLLFGYMGFLARRNIGPFAIVAGPIFARYFWPTLQGFYEEWRNQKGKVFGLFRNASVNQRDIPDMLRRIINLSFVGILLAAGIIRVYLVASPQMVNTYLPETFPVEAVKWIKQNQPPGQLFNSYNWGGYLAWNLREYKVFLDGRTDLYNDDIIGDWLQVVNAKPGWQETLQRYGVHLILLEHGYPVLHEMSTNGWDLLYQDNQAVVYGK